jgi:hypothetical protein
LLVGDVNGDGYADVLVGPGLISAGNYARACSGANGSVPYDWTGPSSMSFYGTAVNAPLDRAYLLKETLAMSLDCRQVGRANPALRQ